jgi:hypothetical protein
MIITMILILILINNNNHYYYYCGEFGLQLVAELLLLPALATSY